MVANDRLNSTFYILNSVSLFKQLNCIFPIKFGATELNKKNISAVFYKTTFFCSFKYWCIKKRHNNNINSSLNPIKIFFRFFSRLPQMQAIWFFQ